jgi:hypothetical protein
MYTILWELIKFHSLPQPPAPPNDVVITDTRIIYKMMPHDILVSPKPLPKLEIELTSPSICQQNLLKLQHASVIPNVTRVTPNTISAHLCPHWWSRNSTQGSRELSEDEQPASLAPSPASAFPHPQPVQFSASSSLHPQFFQK